MITNLAQTRTPHEGQPKMTRNNATKHRYLLTKLITTHKKTLINLPITAIFALNHQVIRIIRHFTFTVPNHKNDPHYQ